MMQKRSTRRHFLKGAGGVVMALPLFESMGARAQSEGVSPPKRFVTMYNPNGTIHEAWFPTGSESEFELGEIHQPLAHHKDKLLIFQGIDAKVTATGPGGPHQRGIGSLFTGRELLEGEFVDGCGSRAGWANGISIDQAIANQIGLETPLKSLEIGVRASEADVQARISYAGPGQPLPPINDPLEVYQRLFANFVATPIDPNDPTDQRASVLDAVQTQFALLEQQLGSHDRQKLAQHLELVRDLERRIGVGAAAPRSCEEPLAPPSLDPNSENDMPAIMQAHLQLLAVAFACDLTRVASLQISTGFNRIRFPWLDSLSEGHSLSHSGPTNETAQLQLVARAKWHSEQLAYFMDLLSQIPEGDGSVLDNTAILWGNEVSLGNTHSLTNIPYLIAGNAGGAINTGRFASYSAASANDLLCAVLNAYGVEAATFGHPDFASAPLSGVLT